MNGVQENQVPNQISNQIPDQIPDMRCLPSLCRGIYNRVALKLGCDPSYVSRVARGERNSEAVSDALRAEIQLTWAKASEGVAAEPADKSLKRKARAATAQFSASKV
jgi:hypothetical protein